MVYLLKLDRPTLWYFDQMQFILEHSIPRQSEDSLSQAFLTDLESVGQNSQEVQESEGELEAEVISGEQPPSNFSQYQVRKDILH